MKKKMSFDWYESECTARAAADLLCNGSAHFKLFHYDDDAQLHLTGECHGQCRPENRSVYVTGAVDHAMRSGKILKIDPVFKTLGQQVYGTRFDTNTLSKDEWSMRVCYGEYFNARHLDISERVQDDQLVFTISVTWCDNTCKPRRVKLSESLRQEAHEQLQFKREKRRYFGW